MIAKLGKLLMKFGPIAIAALMAASEAWNEQKEADRIDDMEERLKKLEEKEEL